VQTFAFAGIALAGSAGHVIASTWAPALTDCYCCYGTAAVGLQPYGVHGVRTATARATNDSTHTAADW